MSTNSAPASSGFAFDLSTLPKRGRKSKEFPELQAFIVNALASVTPTSGYAYPCADEHDATLNAGRIRRIVKDGDIALRVATPIQAPDGTWVVVVTSKTPESK